MRSAHPFTFVLLQILLHARDVYLIHSETRALLESWLRMLRDEGEEKTFAYVRQYLKEHKSEWVR